MKIAFVIGHTRIKRGAYSEYFKRTEWKFWKGFECELNKIGDVFYHKNFSSSYNNRQISMSKRTKDYDLVFELHFNSLDSIASGCEALYYYKNNQTKYISHRFCAEYTKITGSRNRGVKPLSSREQRGYGFVYNQVPNAVILEPFFGDNLNDCIRFDINSFIQSIKNALNT